MASMGLRCNNDRTGRQPVVRTVQVLICAGSVWAHGGGCHDSYACMLGALHKFAFRNLFEEKSVKTIDGVVMVIVRVANHIGNAR